MQTEERPWGSFDTLHEEKLKATTIKVKILRINPGQRLSLQQHRFRAESWVVVQGTGTLEVWDAGDTDNWEMPLEPGETHFIHTQEWHRVVNTGQVPLIIVETQMGSKVEESDIIRKEDDYGRV